VSQVAGSPLTDGSALGGAAAGRGRARARLAEFLAVGGVTVVLFPLAWILRTAVGTDSSELAVGFLTFYGAYVVNDPHFSVTYLLFYRDVRGRLFGPTFAGRQRLRYAFAGFAVPAALCAWAVYAITARSAQALGSMVQLMFLLVGWHYVKQGFGVLSVLSARSGAPLSTRERRVVLFHCYAAWAYAWANPSVPAGDYEEKGVVYRALAHPRWLELTAGAALSMSVVALAWVLVTKWTRDRKTLLAGPLAVFLMTVWSWSIYSAFDPLIQYLIPALHSVQYFYFVWLLRRNQHAASMGPFAAPSRAPHFVLMLGAIGLGFVLFHGLPGLVDAMIVPRRGGMLSSDLGAAPCVAAFYVVVNLHHYFMDTVLWRRENPDSRYLTA
jgi:hypothetical protein